MIHTLQIKITVEEGQNRKCEADISGDEAELAQAVLCLIQNDENVRNIIMDAIYNGISGKKFESISIKHFDNSKNQHEKTI